ncbi:thiol-disulfide oxidoreductase DCC family protein [Paenalkalicoccus suaedae]|uniref:Thiol-disulfide oxidoreductase DCC family protein n=1 Tax=Paenalkalicoccus suaedae TaxID=2592382 RepID=A0A859FDT2_9BACI|nr:thiol-disulfide oxidoreductase DCC family protein [Paenalkalicoccus suaedae]QKS71247.1 thiol-disulfide oxidoreductase DCC family protein [Paenalkalicoccus suaedae]
MPTSIILFDGYCHVCDASIQFIMKHDKKDTFTFASLQGEKGAQLKKDYDIQVDSVVLIEPSGRVYTKSDAALRICKQLSGFPKILQIGLLLPRFLRDAVYELIAKNRYRFFGKRDTCRLPTPEERAKFLDG